MTWDDQAATFDDEPDHGLRDPDVKRAWAALLARFMPGPGASIADLGCGTGSLAVLMAEAGHVVQGVDSSRRMLEEAGRKARQSEASVEWHPGDAAHPPLAESSVDVVLVRHVLWTMPDPSTALATWIRLLRPAGRLILVEGRWMTGAGLSAAECSTLVRQHRQEADVHMLDDAALWGKAISDERYLLLSRH